MTVAAIERQRRRAGPQVAQCIRVRAHKIADMDVVANAGAVRRRIIGAENFQLRPQPQRRFGRDFDQVRGGRARLAGTVLRIGAGDVEITQNHMADTVRGAGIAQHDFAHQL